MPDKERRIAHIYAVEIGEDIERKKKRQQAARYARDRPRPKLPGRFHGSYWLTFSITTPCSGTCTE